MSNLTLEKRISIRTDYLSGLSIPDLVSKHKSSRDLILKILNDDDQIARRLAEEGILQKMQKETDKVLEIKEQALAVVKEALVSVQNAESPHLFLDKVAKAIETLDKIQRLNQSRPTEIQEHRHTVTTFDIAALSQQLDTPEKKKEFLKKQLQYDRDNKNNTTGATSPSGSKVVAES